MNNKIIFNVSILLINFEINKIVERSKGIFDVRRVNTGKKYTVICASDSTKKAQYFIYEIDATNYVVFDLRGEIDVYKGKKPVIVKLKTASGIIIPIKPRAPAFSKISLGKY